MLIFPHGNAHTKGKTVFHCSAPTLLTAMKNDATFSDLMLAASLVLNNNILDTAKDFQLVKNALKTTRTAEKFSSNARTT